MTSLDSRFHEAVDAIDAGDIAGLSRLIAETPSLVRERLEQPGDWLRAKVGRALDGFFHRPYLLWFVAEDPVRTGTLPANIAEVARAIIDAARRERAESLQEQLDHACSLVCWSWIARERGVQNDLIDVLVDAGAALEGNQVNALVNGNVAAAEHLVSRGAPLMLATALCLGWWNDVARLLPMVSAEEKQTALVLAALHGKAEAIRRVIAGGADPSARSKTLYAHATPLHHAVSSGSLEAVTALLAAGADPNSKDLVWGTTPLGWAEYAMSDGGAAKPGRQYAEIAKVLRTE